MGGLPTRRKGVVLMIARWRYKMRTAVVSALGVTILLGTPLLAQADQGKWWTPKEGDRRIEKRERGNGWNDQGTRGDRGSPDRRAWGDRGWNGRGYRSWRGVPVRRVVIVIRDRDQGVYFLALRFIYHTRYP